MAAKLTDLQLIYGVAGARDKFEELCTQLIRGEHREAQRVRVVFGDGGIDAYVGQLSVSAPIDVFQVKFFPDGLGESQKDQIRKSFKSIFKRTDISVSKWTLCLPIDLSTDEVNWFEQWSKRHGTNGIAIQRPWTALELERLLYDTKNRGIKEAFFREDHLAQIRDMSQTLADLVSEFRTRFPDPADARRQRQELSDGLAAFVVEGQQLLAAVKNGSSPVQEINDWAKRATAYLGDHLGASHAVRLSDFSGLTFYSDGSEKSQMERAIDGRLRRLHEFLGEINSRG